MEGSWIVLQKSRKKLTLNFPPIFQNNLIYMVCFIFIWNGIKGNKYKGNQIIFRWENHMFMIIGLEQNLYCEILVFKPRNLGQCFLYQFLGIIISSHIFQVFSMFTDWIKERHFSRLLMTRHLYANFAILFNVVSNALPFAVTSFYTELRVQFLKYFWQA